MRIAHVISTPTGIGGAEKVLMALVERGSERGYHQLVLNPFAVGRSEALATTRGHAIYAPHPVPSWRDLRTARRWASYRLRDFRPEVVHAHLFHALVLVGTMRRPAGAARVLSHQHGNHLVEEGRRLEAKVDRFAGRRFDKVVACSEWVRRFLLERYGYPDRLVTTISNGWTGTPLEPSGNDRPTLVCVARFRKQKGHDVLLRAFVSVSRAVPNARLVLAGDGPERPAIERLAASLGLGESVSFLGSVPDVWPVLARSDVFVLPSLYEPLGIAVLEAMAAGLPVVASSVGGIPELVVDGATGYLVPPRDERLLGDRIVTLLKSATLRARFAEAGKKRAESRTMARMADAYFDLYEDVTSRRSE